LKGLRDSYPEITDEEIADEDYLKQKIYRATTTTETMRQLYMTATKLGRQRYLQTRKQ
jgi:hypothetical protein